jgi:hypothetical protein
MKCVGLFFVRHLKYTYFDPTLFVFEQELNKGEESFLRFKMKKSIIAVAVLIMAVLVFVSPARSEEFQFPSPERQIELWKEANQRGNLGISKEEFASIPETPKLTEKDKVDGFVGTGLFYGFGTNGRGIADIILSGKISWEYIDKFYRCSGVSDYIDFRWSRMGLRPGAWSRPKGFFWKKVHLGQKYRKCARDDRKLLPEGDTGASFEALQLAGILIPEYIPQMNGKDKPFWDMIDYNIMPAPDSNIFRSLHLSTCCDGITLFRAPVDAEGDTYGAVVLR